MKNVNENWVRRYDEKPHGEIGDLRKPFPFLAAMASVRIGWSG